MYILAVPGIRSFLSTEVTAVNGFAAAATVVIYRYAPDPPTFSEYISKQLGSFDPESPGAGVMVIVMEPPAETTDVLSTATLAIDLPDAFLETTL